MGPCAISPVDLLQHLDAFSGDNDFLMVVATLSVFIAIYATYKYGNRRSLNTCDLRIWQEWTTF